MNTVCPSQIEKASLLLQRQVMPLSAVPFSAVPPARQIPTFPQLNAALTRNLGRLRAINYIAAAAVFYWAAGLFDA
jgi:hypothetical protein